MKHLVLVSRILVGSLFIVSGLIKANDPMGFSYKLMDYYAVFGTEFLNGTALIQAVFICVIEVVLGVALLFGSKGRLVSWVLLGMILFFTWLTGYSAVTNTVTDCGCFGDALKLTPWQSFWKDVVLLFFILIIFFKQKSIEPTTWKEERLILPVSLILIAIFSFGVISWGFPVYFSFAIFMVLLALKKYIKSKQIDWIMATAAVAITTAFSVYCVSYLPIRDFRPYAVGKNLLEGMKHCDEFEIPKPCSEYGTMFTFKHKTTGEIKKMNDREYSRTKFWENKDWEMLKGDEYTSEIVYQEGYEPPIHDFTISNDEGDYTEDILTDDQYNFIIVAYDLSKTDKEGFKKIKALKDAIGSNKFIALSSATYHDTEALRHELNLDFPFYSSDATALKTIIRSNPGLMLMKNGTVQAKWPHTSLPTADKMKSEFLK